MKELLSAVSANGAGDVINRTQRYVVSGLAKYKKTGTGTCTLTIKDGTGAPLHSWAVPATDPIAEIVEVAIPSGYYAEVSAASGTIALTVWMDGDV